MNKEIWKGRDDDESKGHLYHHKIQIADLGQMGKRSPGIGILGFESDEGVKRNQGRAGAKDGPNEIRKALGNLVVHFSCELKDYGNIGVENNDLESSQLELSHAVCHLLSQDQFPILLGGGHETAYGHLKGAITYLGKKKVGVVNFDPHFDLRSHAHGPHSGSWARQLFDESDSFHYLPVGIHEAVNVPGMYEWMRDRKQSYMTMDELLKGKEDKNMAQIGAFVERVDHVCITLDLDVFSSGIAPGVSALNAFGAFPQHILPLLNGIFDTGKVIGFDVSEMNPAYDNGRTAKLAAFFVHEVIRLHSSIHLEQQQ